MEPFDLFFTDSYTFLTVSKGGVTGNGMTDSTSGQGLFRRKSELTQTANNQEIVTTDAVLKVPADDPYVATRNGRLEGEAVRVNGVTYRIVTTSEGKDHDTGRVYFYTLKLQEVGR